MYCAKDGFPTYQPSIPPGCWHSMFEIVGDQQHCREWIQRTHKMVILPLKKLVTSKNTRIQQKIYPTHHKIGKFVVNLLRLSLHLLLHIVINKMIDCNTCGDTHHGSSGIKGMGLSTCIDIICNI